jgi:predicted small lipoprotein YifL
MNCLKQVLLAALIATSLAGCGVRGNPEPPPSFTQQ